MVIKKIEGRGDNSMFLALLECLADLRKAGRYQRELPEDEIKVRELLVDNVSSKVDNYGIANTKDNKRALKLMRKKGNLPREELLLAASEVFNVITHVHHGMDKPVVFRSHRSTDQFPVVHLQCLAGIHYNPVLDRRMNEVVVPEKLINMSFATDKEMSISPVELEEYHLFSVSRNHFCTHDAIHNTCVLGFGSSQFCALIDTGSQISIIKETVVLNLMQQGLRVECTDIVEGNTVLLLP